jgi:hypothetical protein
LCKSGFDLPDNIKPENHYLLESTIGHFSEASMQLVITAVFLLDIQLCLSYLELTLKRVLIGISEKFGWGMTGVVASDDDDD